MCSLSDPEHKRGVILRPKDLVNGDGYVKQKDVSFDLIDPVLW